MKYCCSNKYGFTLIELLVVVLIIAVLAMVAMPMYKHAVLKSRFSTVMPVAKAVAEAQEVYYLGNNQYALRADELDIEPVAAEGTSVALAPEAQEDQYNYIAASSTEVPGARYIMYQKHSPKFADTIHCEADETNEDALWLCEKGLNGTEIPGSVNTASGSYKTFLLAGLVGSTDKLPASIDKVAQSVCDENAGCTYTLSDSNEDGIDDTITTKVCGRGIGKAPYSTGLAELGCAHTVYDANGEKETKTYEFCYRKENGDCIDAGDVSSSSGYTYFKEVYGENNKRTFDQRCTEAIGGHCQSVESQTYLADGESLQMTRNVYCASGVKVSADGMYCLGEYQTNASRAIREVYEPYNQQTSKKEAMPSDSYWTINTYEWVNSSWVSSGQQITCPKEKFDVYSLSCSD